MCTERLNAKEFRLPPISSVRKGYNKKPKQQPCALCTWHEERQRGITSRKTGCRIKKSTCATAVSSTNCLVTFTVPVFLLYVDTLHPFVRRILVGFPEGARIFLSIIVSRPTDTSCFAFDTVDLCSGLKMTRMWIWPNNSPELDIKVNNYIANNFFSYGLLSTETQDFLSLSFSAWQREIIL